MNKLYISEFKDKAYKKFGDKFNYDLVEFNSLDDNIKIICPEHGILQIKAYSHIHNKYGCIYCANSFKNKNRIITKEYFIERSSKFYDYDYSKTNIINSSTKTIVICKIHGEFLTLPNNHIKGKSGCPECKSEKLRKYKQFSQEQFLQICKEKHKDKYDYSLSIYNGMSKQVIIICSEGHKFKQRAGDHMFGHGCPRCAGVQNLTNEEFINRSSLKHNNKYSYKNTNYTKSWNKVIITCSKHGDFEQIARDHFNGHGCPKCVRANGIGRSKVELELEQRLKDLKINVIFSDTEILDGHELDLYLPDNKLAIELNGVYWHSEKFGKDKDYHLNKTLLCNKKGINLLQFWDFETSNNFELIFSIIKSKIGIYQNKLRASKCNIKEINNYEIIKNFLDINHLQGNCKSSINLGLYYNNELVSLMTFGKARFNKKYNWELLRFCSKQDYQIYGSASKLFKYFIENYEGSIISYANRRISNGNLYEKLGFEYKGISSPNYFYIKNGRITKRYDAQKHKLEKLLEDNFDKNLSEVDNMLKSGYYRIWDCGNLIYTFNQKESPLL